MSDRIELTDEEALLAGDMFESARRAMHRPERAAVIAISAVNRVRAGDPVGTVRRKPDGKAYAVSAATGRHIVPLADDWGLVMKGDADNWPVVYRPEDDA